MKFVVSGIVCGGIGGFLAGLAGSPIQSSPEMFFASICFMLGGAFISHDLK